MKDSAPIITMQLTDTTRRMTRSVFMVLLLALFLCLTACAATQIAPIPAEGMQAGISTDGLNERELAVLEKILAKLNPFVEERSRQGTQATITFEELYRPLDAEENTFLNTLRNIKPEALGVKTPYLGFGNGSSRLIRLDQSYIDTTGVKVDIPSQYLPEKVNQSYETMMAAMQQEIGRRLYVVSGNRSGAYQLYLFLFYLSNHNWSVRETARFVAFPGYSEHGDTSRQALDFVSAGNISEQSGKFEELPEYRWLMERAACFGFALSYPPNSPTGITFEPWHWHAEENLPCNGK